MPKNPEQLDVRQFVDDDQAYLRWIGENPNGYVVNTSRAPKSNYVVLHRATCKHICSSARSNWTKKYIKTCSRQLTLLESWSRSTTGSTLMPCAACKPFSESSNAIDSEPLPLPGGGTEPLTTTAEQTSQSTRLVVGTTSIPAQISTGCEELNLVWREYATGILDRSQVLIPDTEDALNWHAFLGHSIDMQGFRAAEFVGVDVLTRKAPEFVALKPRGIGVPELASLWEVDRIQDHLLHKTKGVPLSATLEVLRTSGGSLGTSLAEAFAEFPHRKGHWTVRALLQNSAKLEDFRFSFRNWLKHECQDLGEFTFPPKDFRRVTSNGDFSVEMMLRRRLQEEFYQVGPALAAYMLCDWQLWLWNEGRIGVFATFKLDSFHEEFIRKYGKDLIPAGESGFVDWWLSLFPDLPPRLANECIWLGREHGIV